MESVLTAVPLVVFIPLLGMLINLFFGKYFGESGVGFVAVGASALAFLVSVLLWAGLRDNHFEAVVVNPPFLDGWITIPSANLEIPWQFRVDTLSVTMMLVVSGVGSLIHLYAVGYMHGDPRFPRFFVYLNLFLVFMMTLVTGNNILMMFVGWEGVGLCSFLLIGFWFDKARVFPDGVSEGWKNSNAARKAMIANRVGDFGVLMAIFLTIWTFGTLDFYKAGEQPIGGHSAEEEHAPAEEGEEHSAAFVVASTQQGILQQEEHADESEEHTDLANMGFLNQAQVLLEDGEEHRVKFGSVDLSLTTVVTLITLFMLLGATGKSAQIPLFVWLPDAMAGPTPVSALIHAATMVTAGVYMMVRSNVLFYHSDLTSFIVTVIGATTAIMAGFIAVGQWDVKKVLAYSTVSQLGFMVAAVGLGAYGAAMFHLVTHAFFKALLFLGSGSIIHGMEHGHHHLHGHGHGHDEHDHDAHAGEEFDPQDMRNMGGLRHKMPITYWTYLIGTLALAGIFPLAGFWSKDEILADAFVIGWEDGELKGFFALLILLAAAAFTAFYMWRQVSLVFYGAPRHEAAEHASESSPLMTIPLMALAVLSVLGGFMNTPGNLGFVTDFFGAHKFTDWLGHSVVNAHAGNFLWWLALLALGLALGAIFAARQMYSDATMATVRDFGDPLQRDPQTSQGFALANAKLLWDETYFKYIENPYNIASKFIANRLDWELWHDFFHHNVIYLGFDQAAKGLGGNIDRVLIDKGIMTAFARGPWEIARRMRRVQTGFIRTYALTILLGTVLVMLVILLPDIRDFLGI